ncbi:SWIM zinc finger family protein [candidate division KSB1 bacterium]|nr:SWIM zinc finger family protein [candidate division KSB1 bacterium]
MKLKDLNIDFIRGFANPEIFSRGMQYFKSGAVAELEYFSEKDMLKAQVLGNYDDYDVEISGSGKGLSAECNCPYEGYPCKHIVAVCLTFLKNKAKYIEQAREQKQTHSALERKLSQLSREKLEQIILNSAAKYPDFKRELMVILTPNKETMLPMLLKQINRAFPAIESRSYSPRLIIKELQKISSAVEDASPEMKIEVYWQIVDRIITELNAFGMQEEAFENEAYQLMEILVELFNENQNLKTKRQEVIRGLMGHYAEHNCGVTDAIYDIAFTLCVENSDYQILIEVLERINKKESFHSYTTQQLSHLFQVIGDVDAQLKVLTAHLEYGGDYWRLAEFWLKKGDSQKALEIVQEGIEKGTGRKTELYDYLLKYYRELPDIEQIYQLLLQKIKCQEIDGYNKLKADSVYQFLWDYYLQENNYERIKTLLELCFSQNNVDLELYQTAEQHLQPEDWRNFELKVMQFLKSKIEGPKEKDIYWYFPAESKEREVLAEIYAYKNDKGNLLETIQSNRKLLKRYEFNLIDDYPQIYLEKYKKIVDDLIASRGRENYQTAAEYARSIKEIYISKIKKPEAWKKYISDILMGNKQLRALKEEFANL